MKRLVVYHANCMDGFTAAWVFWKVFGEDGAEYLPAKHEPGNAHRPPDLSSYDYVYVVDFSYPRTVLLEAREQAKGNLVVLDHHESARADCEGLEPHWCTFDMNRSGAGLSWDYLHPELARPKLVSYVEDRDLWRFNLHRSEEVNRYVGALERSSFEIWSMLAKQLDKDIDSVADMGGAIKLEVDSYVRAMMQESRVLNVGGHDGVPVVNAPYVHTSELVGELAKTALFAVGWFQRADGRFQYSLRSRGDFDVSKLATIYGGGGHKAAAGFASERGPWDLFHACAGNARTR